MVQPGVFSLGEEHLSSSTPSPICIFCIFSTTTVLQNPGKAHLFPRVKAPGVERWPLAFLGTEGTLRAVVSTSTHFHTQL